MLRVSESSKSSEALLTVAALCNIILWLFSFFVIRFRSFSFRPQRENEERENERWKDEIKKDEEMLGGQVIGHLRLDVNGSWWRINGASCLSRSCDRINTRETNQNGVSSPYSFYDWLESKANKVANSHSPHLQIRTDIILPQCDRRPGRLRRKNWWFFLLSRHVVKLGHISGHSTPTAQQELRPRLLETRETRVSQAISASKRHPKLELE